MKSLEIKSLEDIKMIASAIVNGDIELKVQNSKVVFAKVSVKSKLNIDCKGCE